MESHIWHLVEPQDAFPFLAGDPPKQLEVEIAGRKLLLIRYKDRLWACDAICPHQDKPLKGSAIGGKGILICPWHRYFFDLQSGKGRNNELNLPVFPVKVSGKQILIGFERQAL
jgi:3-phenylpropionate/trans-cinnamate dioxygenase ferredoxin subunit